MPSSPPLDQPQIDFTEISPPIAIDVSARDRRALRQASSGLKVGEASGGRVSVGPRDGYAGSVTLPGGRRIVVHPKAEVASLPNLLALAYRTMELPERAGDTTVDRAPPSEWLLVQFALALERVAATGLRRGYQERRELLPFVRGRLRPLMNPALLPGADCEFTDFTLDTLENQLLAATGRIALTLAQHSAVRGRLRNALAYFSAVQAMQPHPSDFERLKLHPLATYYAPALRLAQLVLEGAGTTETRSGSSSPALFVLMWKAWENALFNAVYDASSGRAVFQPRYGKIITHVAGTPKTGVALQPDIVIGTRNSPRLIVDAKWSSAVSKRQGGWRYNTSHLEQMVTYCEGLDCDGALVYPFMGTHVDATYSFRGRRNIRILTVDLSRDLNGLTETALELARAPAT